MSTTGNNAMNEPINPIELAKTLSPEQFEFLLRAYIKQQADQLVTNPCAIWFWANTGYAKQIELTGHWQVGLGSDKTVTKGEILALVITEHNRRNNFDQSCKLALIEHEPSV